MYEVQGVRLDPASRCVWVRDVEVTLARKEFDLLHALVEHAGEVVTRAELMRRVWHTDFFTSSKTIDVHLGWLRRKLGDDTRRPFLITTLRGKGLRFELAPPARVPGGAGVEAPVVLEAADVLGVPAPVETAAQSAPA